MNYYLKKESWFSLNTFSGNRKNAGYARSPGPCIEASRRSSPPCPPAARFSRSPSPRSSGSKRSRSIFHEPPTMPRKKRTFINILFLILSIFSVVARIVGILESAPRRLCFFVLLSDTETHPAPLVWPNNHNQLPLIGSSNQRRSQQITRVVACPGKEKRVRGRRSNIPFFTRFRR